MKSIRLDDGTEIAGEAYVDGTGDGVLCRLAGCELVTGQESRDVWDEPSAPEHATNRVNGVSLMYRIRRKREPCIDPLPDGVAPGCDWASRFPLVSVVEYPNGDRNVNMLPTMEGREYLEMEHGAAYAECLRRVYATWHHLQSVYEEFRQFGLHSVSPDVGVRESHRVICEYVLTEDDILAGVSREDRDGVIAIADHALDRHGEKGGAMELKRPFGIPFACLIPRGFGNLLVACRAAGFSSIAASSCRLSRTMMQLGQAAGTACALARDRQTIPAAVDLASLRNALRADGVQLVP